MGLFAHWPYAGDAMQYYPHSDWQSKQRAYLDIDGVIRNASGGVSHVRPEDYRDTKLCLLSRWVDGITDGHAGQLPLAPFY